MQDPNFLNTDVDIILQVLRFLMVLLIGALLFVFLADLVRSLKKEKIAWLPRGIKDAIMQPLIFVLLLIVYNFFFHFVSIENLDLVALKNTGQIISFERGLGILWEPSIQTWVLQNHILTTFLDLVYVFSQGVILISFLAWLYFWKNKYFYFVRNTLIIAELIALPIFSFFPVAPPRAFPNMGFVDTILGRVLGNNSSVVTHGVDSFAALPSLHVTFALVISVTLFLLLRKKPWKYLGMSYVFVLSFAVVATANHWLIDIVAGALVALVAVLINTKVVGRWRKDWAWPEN